MNVLKFLHEKGNTVEKMVKKYQLVKIEDKERNLFVLNYSVRSKKFDPLSKECRGLTLHFEENEKNEKTFSVVCKGFDRFYNINELGKKEEKK